MGDQTFLKGKVVLLVDDDEIFREILAETLKELGFNVLLAVDGDDGLKVWNANPSIEVILSDVRMPNRSGVSFLAEVRKVSKIPFVLQTGFSEILETIDASALGASGFLSKPYSSQALMKVLGESLGVVAPKEETKDADFAKIPVDDFVSGKVLNFSIYVRLSLDRYIKIADTGEDVDVDRVRSYKQRGICYLYLRKADFREYLGRSMLLTKRVAEAKTIDPEKRLRFLRHTGTLITEKMLIEDLDSQAVSSASDFFQASLEIISDQEDFFKMLTLLNEHSDHVYTHSVGVSIYSIMIAQAVGWTANPTVFRVGLSGLFHDIGLKEIDQKILDSPRAQLSRAERAIYETHPTRGAEILASCGSVPEEVTQAVLQHHEDPNGFGYPRGLKGKDIIPLSRLVQVADCFCELAIKNPSSPVGMSAGEALERLRHLKADLLDPAFLAALASLVKVPGA